MIDLPTILSIIRADETREIVHCAGMAIALGMLAVPFAVLLYRKFFRRFGLLFTLIMAGFLYSMATKPVIKWDSDYLKDNGSHYTNDFSLVRFKWRKTLATLPNATPLHIARSPLNVSVTNWVDIATSTVGAFTYDLAVSSTNFMYYLYCDYVPPTPVHTNGVWLGQIIEKAKATKGIDKLVIIKGQLLENGKVIAP